VLKMKIVEWPYSVINSYDGTEISSGVVKTTETGTREQAIAKATFRHAGKSRIQIGWKIKMVKKPIFCGEQF
jgi:hypothetical protein